MDRKWKEGRKVGWFIVFNATFNNISVISWQSVLLVEETGGPGENHRTLTPSTHLVVLEDINKYERLQSASVFDNNKKHLF